MSVSLSKTLSYQPPHLNDLSSEPPAHPTPRALSGEPDVAASPHETALLRAYLGAVQSKIEGGSGLVKVPAQSTLGQWMALYRAQLQHPVVQGWMREQKVDQTSLLTLNPRTGALTALVEGKAKTFNLADNSGWGQVSGPLLAAAKVVAPGDLQKLQIRFGDNDDATVSGSVVANFYAEPLPKSQSEGRAQLRRLDPKKAFDPIPADDRLRPANSRSAQAREQLKLNAQTYYTQAPQALAYKHLAVDMAQSLPNVRAQAKQWAEELIFKLTGTRVDADTLYLNRFSGSQSASTATGWEHMNEEPTSSLRLPDALLKNFSEHDWVPGNLDLEAGIYKDGPGQSEKGGYGARNQFALAPSALMHTSWKTDFQKDMTKKIDGFWNAHTQDYQAAIKGEFVYQARKQLTEAQARSPAERALLPAEYQLSREDYRLVMGAASNVPLDEKTPLSVDQLRAEAPAKGVVQAHAFNIKGLLSNDIVRFSAADGGRQVLYIPGAQPAFVRFDSLEKLDQWIIDQTRNPNKREALAAHFPLIARQDHEAGTLEKLAKVFMPTLWFTNVGGKTDGLDTVLEQLATGKLNDPTFDGEGSHIEGDVFSAMTSASKARMSGDADVVIKSNKEVIRDIWLNDVTVAAGLLAKLAPIAAPVAAAAAVTGLTELALGAEKQASGDTLAERNDGASKAFDGLLNTLFSVGGFAGEAKDPFASPEGRIPAPQRPQPIGGFTDWLYDLLSDEPPKPSLTQSELTEFQKKYDASRSPGNRPAFDNGYNSGKPEKILGYSPTMTLPELMKLAAEPWRSAEEVGVLSRVIERLKIKLIQDGYPLFQRDIQSVGGTLTPMPQEFYLSQTNLASQGECAAMANTMALAIESGDENTFLGNLFKAAARPTDAGSVSFIGKLSRLQASMTYAQDFHVGGPARQVPYGEIIADLANSATSKTLRISSSDHALMAGVNMEGEAPKWFYFDPNFGLATFDSSQAFQDGMERTLNRGTSPFRLRALGTNPAVPEYTISEFKGSDYAGNPLGPVMRDLFATAL
jgi:hypothetical protein